MRKLLSTLAVGAVLVLGAGARAEVPFLVPVVGVLTDTDDVPLDGSFTVVFTLYDSEVGGVILGGETQEVDFADGLFRVYLGAETVDGLAITPFIDNQEVWLGVRVGADGEMNRVRMASVPWAFEAATCGQVTDLSAAGIQEEIGADACLPGYAMRGWTGSAAQCVALPSTAGLVEETDIGVTVQAPVDQANFPCNYGIQQISAAGVVVCANQDVVTQCGPEAGLGSNDNYLGSDGACHKAPHACGADEFLDGDLACRAITGTSGALAMFTGAAAGDEPNAPMADSIVSQSGSTVIVTGNVNVGNTMTASTLAATTATVSGTTTTADLSVTNGLPINVSSEYIVYAGDGTVTDPTSRFMTAVTRSMCYLTRVRIHDSEVNNDEGTCTIDQADDGGTMKWRVVASRLGGVDTGCTARCISW